jgi:hypothetical protein
MSVTKIIETEVTTGASAGAATSISSATCVRLYNTHTGDVTVAISTIVGAGTSSYFTMPTKSIEFVQKAGSDVIWTSTGIKANKVAFTS